MEENIFDNVIVLSPEDIETEPKTEPEEPTPEEPETNAADESILDSIKKLLGISAECTSFDTDIILHINSVLAVLNQLGAGPEEGFFIFDSSAKWSDVIDDNSRLNLVKSYVYGKVKLLFDPPASSSVLGALERTISELEWRISILDRSGINGSGSSGGTQGGNGNGGNNDNNGNGNNGSSDNNGCNCGCGNNAPPPPPPTISKRELSKIAIAILKSSEYFDN